jgi:hypothetical protein
MAPLFMLVDSDALDERLKAEWPRKWRDGVEYQMCWRMSVDLPFGATARLLSFFYDQSKSVCVCVCVCGGGACCSTSATTAPT